MTLLPNPCHQTSSLLCYIIEDPTILHSFQTSQETKMTKVSKPFRWILLRHGSHKNCAALFRGKNCAAWTLRFGYMIYLTCNETSSDRYLQSDISKRTFSFMFYNRIDNIANMLQFFKTSAFRWMQNFLKEPNLGTEDYNYGRMTWKHCSR
jgi:hypothetical protein